jgi:hypothetical protein
VNHIVTSFGVAGISVFRERLQVCDSNDILADEETIRLPEVVGCRHNLAASASGSSGSWVSSNPRSSEAAYPALELWPQR